MWVSILLLCSLNSVEEMECSTAINRKKPFFTKKECELDTVSKYKNKFKCINFAPKKSKED